MAEFQKGAGKGSMYVSYGTTCDPQNPNMGNASKNPKTPHDKNDKLSKTVGTKGAKDLRGGDYKGKQQEGAIHNIPEHYKTQNGSKEEPNKRAKVTTGK